MTSSTSQQASAAPERLQGRPRRFRVRVSASRLAIVCGLLLLAQVGLAARLVYLQVYQGSALHERARQQQLVPLRSLIGRRPIIDRNGNVLALDKPTFTLFVHPFLLKEPVDQVAGRLAPLLEQSAADLVKTMQSAESGIPLAYNLSEDTADQVKRLWLDGIELIQQWQRTYPQQGLTSELVGYVNTEHQGQAGLEYSQQVLLEPPLRSGLLFQDGYGQTLPKQVPNSLVRPDDLRLQLTLDLRLQRAARTALQQKLQQYKALRGTVIAMDVQDGSLLALVSEPSYDPDRYYEADPSLFKNWAVSDLYEPGSTFKPINVAIALEAGGIEPDSVFNDEGRITVGGWPIQNNDYSYTGARGPMNITQILEKSSNVGMVHMMNQVKPGTYYDWLRRLGIGEMVNTDLPFATPGQFKDKAQFVEYPIEPATTAFGQGFSVTPLQMAQLHATLANDGKLVSPHIVRGLVDPTGKLTKPATHPQPKTVFSSETAQAVLKMMGSVVENGTGKPAQVPGYRLGGKTGTAQKAAGGTYTYARITSFVSLFPLESPRYVILAVVDEPKGDDAYGSTVAAPIVKSVIDALIVTQGIPPSHPSELEKAKKAAPSSL
jgi:cell division protein FtsI (penicillin-binding protein 3)